MSSIWAELINDIFYKIISLSVDKWNIFIKIVPEWKVQDRTKQLKTGFLSKLLFYQTLELLLHNLRQQFGSHGLTKSIPVIGTLKPSQQMFILIFPIVIQELLHKTLSANQECDNWRVVLHTLLLYLLLYKQTATIPLETVEPLQKSGYNYWMQRTYA